MVTLIAAFILYQFDASWDWWTGFAFIVGMNILIAYMVNRP